MKFANKEKSKLLDFIIGLECISEEFILKLDINYKKIETIEFYTIYKKIFTELERQLIDVKKVFSSPFYPVLQHIYKHLAKTQEINTKEEFIEQIKKLDDKTIRKLVKNLLEKEKLSDSETEKYIHTMNVSADIKYYLLEILRKPAAFRKNILAIFDNVYPIFEKHYEEAFVLFSKKYTEFTKLSKKDVYTISHNFLGSEKLSQLQSEYKNTPLIPEENIDKELRDIEVVPLLFGANRICTLEKEKGNLHTNVIYCLGLDSIHFSEKMIEAEKISKQVLKALSDDTRLDILRMISFGLNTNKKLSIFFKVSPPAITYQTNVLKEAGIVATKEDGTLYVNRKNLDTALHKIEELLSLRGNAK